MTRPHAALLIALALALALAAPPRASADQAVALAPGYVFAATAVDASPALTSAALFSASAAVDQVFTFDAAAQAFRMQVKLVDGTIFGPALPLPAGKGFILKCSAAGSLALPGVASASGARAELPERFTLLGFPPLLERPRSRDLLLAHPALRSLFRWNAAGQSFDFVMRLADGALFGPDFALNEGEGYFLDAAWPSTVAFGRVAAADPLPLVDAFLVADPTAVSLRVIFFTDAPLRATLEIAAAGGTLFTVATAHSAAAPAGVPAVDAAETRTHDFTLVGLSTRTAYDLRVTLPSGGGTVVEPLAGPLRATTGAAATVATPQSLAGKAVDAAGAAVADARVLVTLPGRSSPVAAVTNASGLFLAVLTNLRDLATGEPVAPAPGDALRIDLFAPGRVSAGHLYTLTADDLPYAGEFVLP